MRISTITNWAYGATVLLTGLSGVSFMLSGTASSNERAAVERHLAFDDLGDQLVLGSERRTDEARLYVMRGAQRHLTAFRFEVEEAQTRERALADLRKLGAAPAEITALTEAEHNFDALDTLELTAIDTYQKGGKADAQQILFGPEHERAQAAVLEPIHTFRYLVALRTGTALRDARIASDWFGMIARIMLGLTAVLFLGVLYFVLRRRVAVPLARMTGIVARLARQDYAVEVPDDRRRDEIGDMTQAIQIFRQNGMERDRLEAEQMADRRAKDSILQMMHRLQASETRAELADIVACFVPQTFPSLSGALYVLNETRTSLVVASQWLDPVGAAPSFAAAHCWGVRRGRPHVSNRDQQDITCPHIVDVKVPTLCVPLTAQGDTIGLLYFEERPEAEGLPEASLLYLELIAENIGLALANLQLRERLTQLAVRDGLTGLLNRRCLDQTLNQIARDASAQPYACLMIDIDHFKRFNDEFGHDAGDMVMQHVAQIMLDQIGQAGSVYRFGGEEFTVLLPALDEVAASTRAEGLRKRIHEAPLVHRGRILGHITISIGISASSRETRTGDLVSLADAALLHAKMRGRNQCVRVSDVREAGDLRGVG